MPITMKSCESSSISAYGFDEDTGTLAVQFKSGQTYHYSEVPAEVAAGFEEAESVGVYFRHAVRGKFEGVKQVGNEEESGEE